MPTDRTESDSLGEVSVPAAAYYGAQTARALHNFAIGREVFPRELIRALGLVKKAAALANRVLGALDDDRCGWVVRAAEEVIAGALDEHFPLSVWQTGSGTQTNMNANEVLANRANELAGGRRGTKDPVHPNDHVNRSQSSNDVFPTALHVAAVEQLEHHLAPTLAGLAQTLRGRAAVHGDVVMVGRTHLMDAVPITFGQVAGAWARQVEAGIERLVHARDGLLELALGGTAVGTGLNAPPGFAAAAVRELVQLTGLPFRSAPDLCEAVSASDAVVFASGALKTVAASLTKIANDVRLLASGPRAGIGELELPANEPGSSIMPGKVNPTQCEALVMVCAQVAGNDAAIHAGGAGGFLQLNTARPLLAHALLQSIRLLGDACRSFDQNCAAGLAPRKDVARRHVDASLMLVTALAPRIGYDRAAKLALRAAAEDRTLRECALDDGIAAADFDAWVDPAAMARPHGSE